MTCTRLASAIVGPLLGILACTDATSPTSALVITPATAVIGLAQAQASGIPATFTNHTAATVTLISTSCLGGRITMERALPGGWVPLSPPDVVCAAASIMAPVQLGVAPGASVSLSAYGMELGGLTIGRYRMHVRSTGGDAFSGAMTIQ